VALAAFSIEAHLHAYGLPQYRSVDNRGTR
jgi:hypothetical protein